MRAAGAVLVAVSLVAVLAAAEAAESWRRLRGSAPPELAALASAGRAPADLSLEHVMIFLGLRDRDTLDAVIAAQQDRRSPRFERWLDATEIADRFGPRRTDYERVRGWFTAHGLRVVHDSRYRAALVIAGTAQQVETALATPIRLFRKNGRTYRGPADDPALPESLAVSVRGILGLDDLPKFRPLAVVDENRIALVPGDFAAAYAVTPLQAAGLTGAGRTIAVVARSNFDDGDISAFAERFLAAPPRAPVRKFAGADPGILPREGEETEVLLDTQWAGALAPGALVNVVIGSRDGDIPEALVKAVEDREGEIISISFGLCEPAAPPVVTELFDAFYAIANAQGQTVLVASGDSGSRECAPADGDQLAVNLLASSPHAVAVGGTSFDLEPDGSVAAAVVERVWNDEFGAGGGGLSEVFARPTYQLAAVSGERRGMPDLALAASPLTPGYAIVEDGRTRLIGGTSAGAPALAGVLALISEQLAATQGRTALGQLLPALYRLGTDQVRGAIAPVFRDVALGTNGDFAAGPGFDLATGWGAPLADALGAALAVVPSGPCDPALNCLVPGRRVPRRACAGGWLLEHAGLARTRVTGAFPNPAPRRSQVCHDGDPACDADGAADGRCTLGVALCLNIFDSRFLDANGLPVCQPGAVRHVKLLAPSARPRDSFAAGNRRALKAALRALPDLPTRLRSACTATVPVVVPVRGPGESGRARLHVQLRGRHHGTSPRLTVHCRPS